MATGGDSSPGWTVSITVAGVPDCGDVCIGLTESEAGSYRLEDLKWLVEQHMETLGGPRIPRSHWAFHSEARATPWNMPVSHLRAEDFPLKFSWHSWSASYLQYHGSEAAPKRARITPMGDPDF